MSEYQRFSYQGDARLGEFIRLVASEVAREVIKQFIDEESRSVRGGEFRNLISRFLYEQNIPNRREVELMINYMVPKQTTTVQPVDVSPAPRDYTALKDGE